MSGNGQYRGQVVSLAAGLGAARFMLEAETALLDIRLAAVRHAADFEDTAVIVDTEALMSRVEAWKSDAAQAFAATEECLDILKTAVLSKPKPAPEAVQKTDAFADEMGRIKADIAEIEAEIAHAHADLGSGTTDIVVDGYMRDPVFRYLLERSARIQPASTKRLSAGDRWLSTFSVYVGARAGLERASAMSECIHAWIGEAEDEITRLKSVMAISAAIHADESRTVSDRSAAALCADAATAANRAWAALLDLVDVDGSEFSRLENEAVYFLARETAAAAVRASVKGEPPEPIPFEAEQDRCVQDMASARAHIDGWRRDCAA